MAKATKRTSPALRVIDGGRQAQHIDSQPSVRSHILWTPTSVQNVERTADAGDMYRLGDLIDQILADDRIGELLENLVTLALGCPLSFEKGPAQKLGEAERAKELEEDFPTGWRIDELTLFGIYKQLAGFCFARHEGWSQNRAGRMVPHFRTWHPKHFRYDLEKRTWLWRDERGRETAFVPGDGEWVGGYRRGAFRPWAQGLWRGLARWWMLKSYAISDWGVHSEKASKLVLSAGEGVEPETRKALADDIVRAAKDTIISLPIGFSLDLIEISASTRDIYLAQVQAAEEAAAIAILGQNLTTKVEGGSYAAAQEHSAKENRKVAYVARELGAVLQQQSISFWAEYNFGDRHQAPFPRWETDPPEDKTEKVGTLSTLATALVTLQQAGFKLTPEQIEEDYGFKLEAMSDAEKQALKPEPPLPAPDAPAGSGDRASRAGRRSNQSKQT